MTSIHPQIRFLLFTLLVNAISFGIIVPVTPNLVMELGHADAAGASAIGGLLALSYAVFQFIFGPLMGNLSDSIGRRPVLLASLASLAIDFLVMAVAPSLFWLFLARILTGIAGASNAPAQSAIADLVTPDERARVFAMLGAAFGIGFVIGPAIGGILGEFGHRVPFYAAGLLAAFNFAWGVSACKETLPQDKRRAFSWQRANPFGALSHARVIPGILPIVGVYFLWQLASLVYPLIWPYFSKAAYGWSPGMIGLSLAQIGIGMALVNLFVTPKVVARYGEYRAALIGIGCGMTTFLAYAVAPNTAWALAIGCLMPFQSMVHPALTAMMTRAATADSQGEMQGIASSAMALGSVLAPMLFNPVHAYFISSRAPFRFDGAPMIAATVVALIALMILSFSARSAVRLSK
ncbi:MAG: TCR/Tet family MFS transporter [Sphingomonadales bacterium]|nr:TCR/Tet family MFS transporter [Sphingomonadales bacterium]